MDFGGFFRPIAASAIVAALVLAGCSGDDDATPSIPSVAGVSTTDETIAATTSTSDAAVTTSDSTSLPSTIEATSTTEPTESTTEPTTTNATTTNPTTTDPTGSTTVASTTVLDTGTDGVTEAEAAWSGVLERAAAADATADDLMPAASEQAAGLLTTFFRTTGDEAVEVASFPSGTLTRDGTVTVEDCIWHDPAALGEPSFHFTAQLSPADGGWQVTGVQSIGSGCIPAEIANEVIPVYLGLNELSNELTRAPNPDDPRLDAIAAGDLLASFRQFLTDLRETDRTYWGDGEARPGVREFVSPSSVLIESCIDVEEGFGFHDSSGALTGDLTIPRRENFVEVVGFELIDGAWVATTGGASTFDCATEQVPLLTVVGSR